MIDTNKIQNTAVLENRKPVEFVSFRDMVTNITSTTYASHGMYFYPARFIPQVVSWFIKNYTKEGDWVIDPFAGGGTVAIECLINARNVISLDLNPLLEPILAGKTSRSLDYSELLRLGNKVIVGSKAFEPRWSRLSYWYEPRILELLKSMWGAYYENPSPLVLLALFKVSRRFSYADDQIPKICTSKRKKKEIEDIFQKNEYKYSISQYFEKSLLDVYKNSLSFISYYRGGDLVAKGNIDLPNYKLDRNVNHLITSPPYGRAHEYIRSFKLELAWLGYDDTQITALINKEIPYRKRIPDVQVESLTYEKFRRMIDPRFLTDYDCYFKSVVCGLNNIMDRVSGYAGLFVGNATFGGVEPPYYQIFAEHFENRGFQYIRTLVDEIKSHKLFKGRKNLSPDGIKSEYLVILEANREKNVGF